MAIFMVKQWLKQADFAMYGVEWAGTSDPAWTRTDSAVNFSDPNPQYKLANNTWSVGSSPFDNIMPWSGMREVIIDGNTLVEIPKFWFKYETVTVNNKKELRGIKISHSQRSGNGWMVSPAHMDRGDGIGERDYVYIGRYHCASDYKSKSGVAPIYNTSISVARSGIHNLGSYFWDADYAMRVTIWLLYLVEFAHWNSQDKIGAGAGDLGADGPPTAMGYTDSMTYHTGTSLTSKSANGFGTQYRYIEGLWDNIYDWMDGSILYNGGLYITKDPSSFGDTTSGGTLTHSFDGEIPTRGYVCTKLIVSDVPGFEWVLAPGGYENVGDNNGYTYLCDSIGIPSNSSYHRWAGSGDYGRNCKNINTMCGLFHMFPISVSHTFTNNGFRLMVLPPSRLSA